MSKHTPGPWNFHPCDEYVNCCDVLCEKGYYVATTHDGVRGGRNADANARLIAAAPDLLDALRLIATAQERGFGIDYAKGCALAAIRRATGEHP